MKTPISVNTSLLPLPLLLSSFPPLLQATLERTHQALEEEKRRTVDLLYSIFPGDVAQRLWRGQPVPARKFEDVTMLFSDIVGFTAVCAQCTPMQVISMLNELYTRFDYQCGILDVYKVGGRTPSPSCGGGA
ncbi:Guanylate cyclase soluble subunit alpha-2 [Liparis tanakae]|uniref:guanylate cyclase n=1 Tax=Liparis tanakae TaxID=230148 RepID=A0A4Z2E5L2_9TELE|nr:Guanylate cyclase soluble subunit alpha-2 [Liparis tanakae]